MSRRRQSMKLFFLIGPLAIGLPLAGTGCGKSAQAPSKAPTANTQVLTKIDLTKWKVTLKGGAYGQIVPAYAPFDERGASAVVEVGSGLNRGAVSSLAVVTLAQNAPLAFMGGTLGRASAGLLSVGVVLHNAGDNPASFRIADIAFLRVNSQRLPVVAVSKWDSPLVAKLSDEAVAASLAVPISVGPGSEIRLNYCFAVDPNDLPLVLRFGTSKTNVVLKDFQSLEPLREERGGLSVSMAGQIKFDHDVPVLKYEALTSKGEAFVRFQATDFHAGDTLAASGGVSYWYTVKVRGTLNREAISEEIPAITLGDGDMYRAGVLSILQPITPIHRSVLISSHEVVFTGSFQAQQGDVMGAIAGSLDDLGGSVLSTRTITGSRVGTSR